MSKKNKSPKLDDAEVFASRMKKLRKVLDSEKASKSEKKAALAEIDTMRQPVEVPVLKEAKEVRKRHAAHIARVAELAAIVADPSSKKKKIAAAEAELAELRAAGEKILAAHVPADVDRADAAAVKAYNEAEVAEPGGINLLTSEAEVAKETARLAGDEPLDEIKARVQAKKAARAAAKTESEKWTEARDGTDPAFDPKTFDVVADVAKKAAKKLADVKVADPVEVLIPALHVAEEVLTEDGREFAVGAAPDELGEFVDPITGEVFDPEQNVPTNGQGRPLIWDPEAEKLVAYSRVTTFIDKLDDKTMLESWKIRSAIAGTAIDATPTEDELDEFGKKPGSILERAATFAFEYEAEIKKTDKLDRKGKLFAGERATRLLDAKRIHDRGLDALGEEALTIAGTHLKAEHGTYLHMLTAVYDTDGADALRALDPSPADLADVMAYAAAMKKLEAEVIDVERRVVIDAHGVTGTLDRSVFYRPLQADGTRSARRVRVVGDLKTGRIDFGAGKISMQLAEYATGEGYDPMTHERTKLGLSKTVALLIHLPAGTATCTIYEVDLSKGLEGIKHAIAVSGWRKSTTEAQAYRGKAPFYREVLKVTPDEVQA